MMKLLIALALLHGAAANPIHERLPSVFSLNKDGSNKFTAQSQKFVLKDRSIHERRSDIKKGLRTNGNVKHEVIFSVKQDLDELKTLVDDISNPFSANFGKHLKRDEVNTMTAIPESFQHVVAYLKFYDIEIVKISKHSEYITASAPVSLWEELFATEFHSFEVESLSVPVIRAEHYSLPENLHAHVNSVFNTIQFPLPKAKKNVIVQKFAANSIPEDGIIDGTVTPQLLYDFYDIRSTVGSSLTSQGVYESQDEAFSPLDLSIFQATFGLPADTVDSPLGYNDDNACLNHDDCYEGNLDVQYITAVASGVPTYYLYDDAEDFLLSWATGIAEMEDPPKVLSISWGGSEMFYSSDYIDLFNAEALKLASMGVTIVGSSGDDGVSGVPTRYSPRFCGYAPDFPSSSVYVTVLGATMGPENGDDEVACQVDLGGRITTGGGFSFLYGTPSWQTEAVASYFTNAAAEGSTPVIGYNAGGRGYPDVSLLGHDYLTVNDGELSLVSGTSASAPVFAGMVSLVNSKRLEAGKSALGWLNPSLYALADLFVNDITKGSNNCGIGLICCTQGFTATSGWDPVTGLGSVNYTSFEAAFFALGDNADIPTVKPTLAPNHALVLSKAPTFRPTRPPTVAPTIASGWLYANYYADADCTGDIDRVEGWKTNVCIYGGESGTYFKFYCDAVNGYMTVYSDSECEFEVYYNPMGLNFCSSPDVQYYYAEDSFSVSMACTTSSAKPLDTSTSYVVQRHFDTAEGCNVADEFQFDAFRNKNCFSHPQDATSFKYRFPDYFYYDNSSTCSGGNPEYSYTETLDTTCSNEESYGYYFYRNVDGSVKYQFIESTTTRSPTHIPSAAPTYKPEYHMLSVEQTIHGISAETFNSDLDVNTDAFTATIADCMEGINSEDVTITAVTDLDSAAARLRRLTSTGVHIDYTVTYDISALGYHGDAEGAYNSLVDSLQAAISGTHFNRFLAANIATYNATTLESASGGNLVSTSTDADVDDDPSVEVNHKKRQTRYFIIGVIAGGGGFLILAWFVIYTFYHCTNPAAPMIVSEVPPDVPAAAPAGFEAVNTKETEMVSADHK